MVNEAGRENAVHRAGSPWENEYIEESTYTKERLGSIVGAGQTFYLVRRRCEMKVAIGLSVVFLVATQGCGPTRVLYKPDVDQAQIQADREECEDKASFYTGGGPMIGRRRSELDQNYYDCMKAKGYMWGDEKDVPESSIVPIVGP